jgi:hypothetical protein
MKILFKKITAATLLTLSTGLYSCEQDKSMTPAPAMEQSSENMRTDMSPTLAKKYQLTKHGDITLTYYADGKLQKAAYNPTVRGGFPEYTTYTYQTNKITSIKYKSSKKALEIVYLLDAKGNCYESKHTEFVEIYPNPAYTIKSGFMYIYNYKGRLMLRQDISNSHVKSDFSYDTSDNLTKITNWAYGPGAPNSTVQSESTFDYNQLGGDPRIENRYPINVEAANLPDPYLQIFGKPGKFLISMVTEKGVLGSKYHKYVLNADGYPTSRQVYKTNGALLIENKAFDYLVTNIGLNL